LNIFNLTLYKGGNKGKWEFTDKNKDGNTLKKKPIPANPAITTPKMIDKMSKTSISFLWNVLYHKIR
jgi:hypothetical protein